MAANLRNRGSRLWSQLAILVVTLALCDGLLSVASCSSARLRYYLTPPRDRAAVPDAVLGRRMSPFFPGHDPLGFRNAAVPDRVDLLAVGDSLTYGYAALPDGSWPYHLQQLSNRLVYNAGVGGYGPLEYSVTIDELMKLQPTTVLLGLYLGNDLQNTYVSVYADHRFPQFASSDPQVREALSAADAAPAPELTKRQFRSPNVNRSNELPLLQQTLDRSALYSIARNVYVALRGEEYRFPNPISSAANTFEAARRRPGRIAYDLEPKFRTVFRDPEFLSVAVNDTDPRVREGGRIAKEALLSIHKRLKAKGVRLVVVLLPYKATVYAERLGDPARSGLPRSFFNLVRMEQRHAQEFREFLSERGIEFADARSAMMRAFSRGVQPYPETEDDHPNTNGYRAIAETVLPMVTVAARTAR
jgi:SGNH hydrolase-like domain, acetyltransferase AlgX